MYIFNHHRFQVIVDDQKTLLKDSYRNRDFEINDSISFFISCFDQKISIDQAKATFLSKVQGSEDDIDVIFSKFLDQLTDRSIIIDYAKYQKLSPETFAKTLVGDKPIGPLKQKKVLYDNSRSKIALYKDHANQPVILKFLYNKNRKSVRKKLDHEHMILQRIRSIDCVIQIIDHHTYNFPTTFDQSNYLMMEYFKGFGLFDLILNRKISLKDRLYYFDKIITAYVELYKVGVLHGDIHPNNILIDHKTKSLKLIDFGESIILDETTHKNAGLSYFCPPERLNESSLHKFKHPINAIGEAYQLTLLLYFMLNKGIPFDGKKWSELISSIKTWTFQPLKIRTIKPNDMAYLNSTLEKGLTRNLDSRYPSVKELQADWAIFYDKHIQQL